MSIANKLILQKDRAVMAAIAKGQKPDMSGVADVEAYFTGFIQRQAVGKSWAVVESLGSELWNLDWCCRYLINNSLTFFPYERAQANMEFMFAVKSLSLDLAFWLAARKTDVAKYYDSDSNGPDEWDIYQANDLKNSLDKVLELGRSLQASGVQTVASSPVDLNESLTEILPIIQSFRDYLPEFLQILDQSGYLNLTGTYQPQRALPKLEITLPGTIQKAYLPWTEMLQAKTVVKADGQPVGKAASDFQGFVIGLVQAPGSPDERDLHGNWASKEDIERACDNWALNYAMVGIGHTEIPEDQGPNHPHFVILRNWIQIGDTTIGGRLVKDGSWLQAYQAVSEWALNALKNYEINGLSPGGSARFIPD